MTQLGMEWHKIAAGTKTVCACASACVRVCGCVRVSVNVSGSERERKRETETGERESHKPEAIIKCQDSTVFTEPCGGGPTYTAAYSH